MKILLAVDGSRHSMKAVDSLIEHARFLRERPQIELVTVHLPVPKLPRMNLVVSKSQIERYYREEGEQALAETEKKLKAARIAFTSRILVGNVAETIATHALRYGCDLICVGTHGRGTAGRLLLGSVATRLSEIARVPLLLVRSR